MSLSRIREVLASFEEKLGSFRKKVPPIVTASALAASEGAHRVRHLVTSIQYWGRFGVPQVGSRAITTATISCLHNPKK
jgi:hypothetical protein